MRHVFALALALSMAATCWAAGSVLVRVEAEEWSAQGGGSVRVLDNPDASGGKTVSYWEDHGVWLEVVVDVPEAGSYALSLGYALAWPETRRRVILNGRDMGEVTLPGTGAWTVFETTTTDMPLPPLEPGRHTLRLLNANSVGLSLDWLALHTTDVFLTDWQLTEPELRMLPAPWREPLRGGGQSVSIGRVQLSFDDLGRLSAACVAGVVLAAPTSDDTRPAIVSLHETTHFGIASVDGPVRQVWISDGRNLYMVAVCPPAILPHLPAPVLGGATRVTTGRTPGGRQVYFSVAGWEPLEVERLEAGGLHITASTGLRVGPWRRDGIPDLRLVGRRIGEHSIGAAKWSTRWGRDEPAIRVEHGDGRVIVRDGAGGYPTLAAFYGERPFELKLSASSIEFTDLASGESITME